MIYVPLDELQIPDDWNSKALAADFYIQSLPIDQRSKAINDRDEIWAELKPYLKKLNHSKCWYCETSTPRDDNAVDHYRPKNAVKYTRPRHLGYTWLAFKPSNFRFTC